MAAFSDCQSYLYYLPLVTLGFLIELNTDYVINIEIINYKIDFFLINKVISSLFCTNHIVLFLEESSKITKIKCLQGMRVAQTFLSMVWITSQSS